MVLPTLYKKTSTGAIQSWLVKVDADTYHTISGQLTGKKTVSVPTFCKGKNPGKKNATSDVEQTSKEAFAKWESKKKNGYVESVEDAQAGIVNKAFVAGGYNPMLAEKFRDQWDKIIFPCFGQPKLDGHRGTIDNGKLFSRTRKPILSCPHIESALYMVTGHNVPWDGELYNHDLKDEFEKLSSAIRKSTPQPECLQVQYHIYDIAMNVSMEERVKLMGEMSKRIEGTPAEPYIKFVPTELVENKAHAKELHDKWVAKGFEGYMLRNKLPVYQYKRSVHLQKIKEFQDAEFKVVGVNEGKGKFKGLAATFVCEINDKKGVRTFKATANGTLEQLKSYLDNFDSYVGKFLTVEFITYTRKNNVPKHGRGIRFRDTDY